MSGETTYITAHKPSQQGREYVPAGRLVPIFSPHQNRQHMAIILDVAKHAASRGETVLMLDCLDGELMTHSGIIYHKTLSDLVDGTAQLRDVQYVTSNEHFTAMAAGEKGLDLILGSLAALSLQYDWVFVGAKGGCSAAHIRMAQAADFAIMTYDTAKDNFMRAYWMMEAVRERHPKFDPLLVSMGDQADSLETADLLQATIREFLGAPPPYMGHEEKSATCAKLVHEMTKAQGKKKARHYS